MIAGIDVLDFAGHAARQIRQEKHAGLADIFQRHVTPQRRVFHSAELDLVVWLDDAGLYKGFELAYRNGPRENAVRWKVGRGYAHDRVDDGEGRAGRYKGTPMLAADGAFKRWSVARQFQLESRDLDPDLAGFILRKLIGFRKPLPAKPRILVRDGDIDGEASSLDS